MADQSSRLTNSQFYQLCNFVKTRNDEFRKSHSSLVSIAKAAARELSFEVSAHAVKNALVTTGIQWAMARTSMPVLGQMNIRISALEKQVAELSEYLEVLTDKSCAGNKLPHIE